MATVLDIGAFEFFVPLISFIFVFLILFGILQKTKLLGGKSALDFVVSLMITLVVVINTSALALINFMSVWSVVVVVVLVFVLMMLFFWVKEGEGSLPGPAEFLPSMVFWVFVIILIIGITHVFGPVLTPYAEGASKEWVVLRTLFHPRIVGALVLLWIVVSLTKVVGSSK